MIITGITDDYATFESLYEYFNTHLNDMDEDKLAKYIQEKFNDVINKIKSSLWLDLFSTNNSNDIKFVECLQLSDENWDTLSLDAIPSITFARKFKDKINWNKLYYKDTFTEFTLYQNEVKFKSHEKAPYSMEFVEEFAPYIDFEVAYNKKGTVRNNVIKKYVYDLLQKQKIFLIAIHLAYNHDGEYDF